MAPRVKPRRAETWAQTQSRDLRKAPKANYRPRRAAR